MVRITSRIHGVVIPYTEKYTVSLSSFTKIQLDRVQFREIFDAEAISRLEK